MCRFTSVRIGGWQLLALLLVSLIVVLAAGCATKPNRTEQLLARDYQTLSNDDLLLYYYQLGDQIEADEARTRGSAVTVGIGTGLFGSGSHVGGGVGMTTGVGERETATELRARRNQVRLELQRRGLSP